VSRRLLVPAVLLLAGLAACGTDTLSAAQVASSAEKALEKQTGFRPDVSCPKELSAEVGAHMRCTLTAGDDPTTYGLTVTVTSVDGDTPDLKLQVDQQPAG